MARLPRLTVPGLPHHVIQRGNNRQPIFLSSADREVMLRLLAEHSRTHGVAIHAYVLMDNHVHLLVTPQAEQSLPRMMQSVGRAYAQHFNRAHGRTGTLFEGRYKSTLIQTERYLMACMAYIDLNPVRAGMVHAPDEFVWSSHLHYLGRRKDRLVTPHAHVWNLGNTPFAREMAYAELVASGIAVDTQRALTDSVLGGWALGEAGYLADLQKRTDRRAVKGRAGRPFGSAQARRDAAVLRAPPTQGAAALPVPEAGPDADPGAVNKSVPN